MAISYVNKAEYTFAGTANTAHNTTIPTGIAVGDLLICGFGNVSSVASAATMNNSWTKLREVGIDSTNCYFLMAAKIATQSDVDAAGTTQQVATGSASTGNTNKTSECLAYRGTYNTVATAVIAHNVVHETSPADQTINTGSASATDTTQWYAFFYNMADSGNETAHSFSTDAGTIRGQAKINNSTSTTSCVAGGDSNGTISVASHSRNGTWSGSATRLNAAIAILAGPVEKSDSDTGSGAEASSLNVTTSDADTGAGTEASSLAVTTSDADTGSGVDDSSIAVVLSDSDTGSGTEAESLAVAVSDSDTGSSVEAESLAATLSDAETATGVDSGSVLADGDPSDGDTGSALEDSTIVVTLADADTGSAAEAGDIDTGDADVEGSDEGTFAEAESIAVTLSSADTGTAVDFGDTDQPDPVNLGDYAITLVMGPATIWIADYGTTEPTDTDDLTGVYLDMGTSLDGVILTVKHKFESPELMQEPTSAASRLKKRELTVGCKLAQPTLTNLLYALNHGSVTSGAGYETYEPPMIDRATPLTYRTVIIDGWAPSFNPDNRHKKRRIILRRCLSTQGAELSYTKDNLTAYDIQWDVHRIDDSTAPFKIIEEA